MSNDHGHTASKTEPITESPTAEIEDSTQSDDPRKTPLTEIPSNEGGATEQVGG